MAVICKRIVVLHFAFGFPGRVRNSNVLTMLILKAARSLPAVLVYMLLCCKAPAGEETTATNTSVTILGRVTHLSDVPLSGALVILCSATKLERSTSGTLNCECPTSGQLELARAKSDETGQFRMSAGYAGKAVLLACSDKYEERTSATLTLDSSATAVVNLRFLPSSDFSVFVTEAGNPVSSATVRIAWSQGTRSRQGFAQTAANGRVQFDKLPTDAIEKLEVRSANHVPFECTDKIHLPVTDYSVRLERRGSVEVNVNDTNPAREKRL